MSQILTQTDALVELRLLSQEVSEDERDAFYIKILNSDLPMEVVTRLTALWDVTKEAGGRVIHVGKLIVGEIIKFIEKYPHFTIGLAIGAAVHALLAAIPLVGVFLAPLAAVISTCIGFRLDTGRPVSDTVQGTLINTFADIIAVAKMFLQWFIDLVLKATGTASA